MADELKNIPGSTAIPTEVSTPVVSTERVNTREFQMGGVVTDGISVDPEDISPRKLVTSFALQKASNDLQGAMASLTNTVNEFTFKPVLSEALASPHFVDLSLWQRQGWMIDNGQAIYANSKAPQIGQAILRLSVDAFLHPGNHYLDMTLTQVPAGACLTVVDYHGNVVLSAKSPGQYRTIFNVDHPGTFYLDFRADDMEPGTVMVIDSISVHRLKPEFESYVDYMAMMQVSGGHGFATADQVAADIKNLETAIRNYINISVSALRDQMIEHINDRETNPHAITTSRIHAATDDHTHDFKTFAGMGDTILVPLQTTVIQLDILKDQLNKHLAAENPHGIDPYNIGAAPSQHEHAIEDILQLADILDEIQTRLSTETDTKYQDLLAQLQATASTLEQLYTHFHEWEEYVNESLECAPESLGIIFATPAEAQDGTRDDRYMSPELTRLAVESWSVWKDQDVTKRYGRAYGHFILTKANPSVKLEVNPEGLYQLILAGDSNWGIQHLNLTLNGTFSNTSAITCASKDSDSNVSYPENLTGNILKICPTIYGVNRIFGTWTLLPFQAILYGNGIGYRGEADNITGGPIRIVSHCAHNLPGKQTGCTEVTLSLAQTDDNSKVEFYLYELVGVQEQHGIAADANPAGTIIERFGNAPIRDYSLFDGSILRRDVYEDLYKNAVASGRIISQADWQVMVDAVGVCESFHDGDGVETFGLPKLDTSGPINKYIKLKNTFLANPGQIFFEYVWS